MTGEEFHRAIEEINLWLGLLVNIWIVATALVLIVRGPESIQTFINEARRSVIIGFIVSLLCVAGAGLLVYLLANGVSLLFCPNTTCQS